MNYVREELLRQREALRLLLVGRERSVERGETAPADERPEMFSAEDSFPVETAVVPAGDDMDLTAYTWREPEMMPENRVAGRRGKRRPPVAARRQNGGQSEGLLRDRGVAAYRAARAAETAGAAFYQAAPASDGTPVRTVVETVTPVGHAETGAADLSRAFQRDARRYDGGFSLY